MKNLLVFSGFMALVFYLTFLVAFVAPTRVVRVGVDWLGEANLELILLSIAFVFTTGSLAICFKEYYWGEKK